MPLTQPSTPTAYRYGPLSLSSLPLLLLLLTFAAARPLPRQNLLPRPRTLRTTSSAADLAACYEEGHLILDYISQTSKTPSSTVHPPPGWKVLSGGCAISNDGGLPKDYTYLLSSAPALHPNGTVAAWTATVSHQKGKGVEATAVVLYDPDDRWDIVVAQDTAVDSGDKDDVIAIANLPKGYALVGTGATLEGMDGSTAFLRSVRPDVTSGSLLASMPGRALCTEDADGESVGKTPSKRSITAFAVGLRRRPESAAGSVGDAAVVRAAASTGKGTVGATEISAQVAALSPLDDAGYAVTAVGAAVLGMEDIYKGGSVDVLKPTVFGEEATTSAKFTEMFDEEAVAEVHVRAFAVMIKNPVVFY